MVASERGEAWQRPRARHRHGDEQIRVVYACVTGLAEDTGDMKFTKEQLAGIRSPMLIVHGERRLRRDAG